MNTQKAGIILSCTCLFIGILCFLIQHEFILLRFPAMMTSYTDTPAALTHKKEITCYKWHATAWQEEQCLCLWSEKKETNIKQLITVWLPSLESEHTTHIPKTTVQAVALNQAEHHAFISFDRNPLPQEGPFYLKLMWIEGLLKTMRDNSIALQSISFLHNHQILQDTHLDFSQPWPLSGFLNQSATLHHAGL